MTADDRTAATGVEPGAADNGSSAGMPGPDLFADDGAAVPGQVVLEPLTGDAVVLRVSGALDLALSPMMRQVTERAVRRRPRLAVIDLTAVEFLASVGMAELLRAQTRLREHDAVMRVVAAGRVVLRPLMLTRLIDEFDIYPSLDEAVTADDHRR